MSDEKMIEGMLGAVNEALAPASTNEPEAVSVEAVEQDDVSEDVEEQEIEKEQDSSESEEGSEGEQGKQSLPSDKKGVADDTPLSDEQIKAGLSPRAQQRFQDLSERAGKFESLRALLDDSVSSPAEFVQLLDFSRAVRNGQFQQAVEMLDRVRNDLVLKGGIKSVPQKDVLDDFPDLKQEVEEFNLTPERALELARARKLESEYRQQQAHEQRNSQELQQYQQAVEVAVQQVQQLEAEWARTDPDYKAKMQRLAGQISNIGQQYQPSQWASVVAMLYQNLSMPASTKKPQSHLRPAGAGGKSKPAEPKSLEAAIGAALGW